MGKKTVSRNTIQGTTIVPQDPHKGGAERSSMNRGKFPPSFTPRTEGYSKHRFRSKQTADGFRVFCRMMEFVALYIN